MIKQCSECLNVFDPMDRNNPKTQTCSLECSRSRKNRLQRARSKEPAKRVHNRERVRDWRKRNHERFLEWTRDWQAKNRDKRNSQARDRYDPQKSHNAYVARRDQNGCGTRKHSIISTARARDGDNCTWCGNPIDFAKDFDVDHWKPLSAGGTSDLDNLSCMHVHCNRGEKGDAWPLPSPPWEGKAEPVQLTLFTPPGQTGRSSPALADG